MLEGMIRTQHGASGFDLPQAGIGGRSADATVKWLLRAVPAAVPDCLFVGRPIQQTGVGSFGMP